MDTRVRSELSTQLHENIHEPIVKDRHMVNKDDSHRICGGFSSNQTEMCLNIMKISLCHFHEVETPRVYSKIDRLFMIFIKVVNY